MSLGRAAIAGVASFTLSACSIPLYNQEQEIEVGHIVGVVECELFAASTYFSAELDPKKPDKWDIGSTLDLTLVRRVEADGRVAWVIPVGYTATPSIGGYGQDTVTAHVEFSTDLSGVKGRARECRMGPDRDPSGTGLGLASWIATTFNAIGEDRYGG